MKYYYKIKPEIYNYIKTNKDINNRKIAQRVGVTENYISLIVNGKKPSISKSLAVCFSKAINPEWEIEDAFDILEKI
jgi:plasmid maintenance system antidote protein VapI